MKRAKAWHNNSTGESVIVLNNNHDIEDVKSSIFHEVVAHKGLRDLVGGERQERDFYLEIYGHTTDEVENRVNEKARKHGYDSAEATKEYLGDLIEKKQIFMMILSKIKRKHIYSSEVKGNLLSIVERIVV